ncbi:MAG: DNA repair protein RadC [Armatimonadetes bacterium]|nr:DNA repair protein RadC [Armatimonadota bacterium]MDW8028155.1 DNA repair protein RadC [Armatimonadota bacterium]
MSEETKGRWRLKDLPPEIRPRERLARDGEKSLSDAELIAIILRTGTQSETALELAQKLLYQFGGLQGLYQCSISELASVKGVGMVKACQIKAAMEIGRRTFEIARSEKIVIRSPADAAKIVMPEMRYLDREHLKGILLNSKNMVIDLVTVSVGTLNASLAHLRECFKEAIRQSAAAIIFAHNHPSGDPSPSPEDISLTKQLVEAGKLLGIEVLDRLIIGDGVFVSLKERGLIS